jgi:ribosomal protein S18 acetylase RimI-like enzyme
MSADRASNLFAKYTPRQRSAHDAAAAAAAAESALPRELAITPMTAADVDGIARLLAWREGISSEDAGQRAKDLLNLPHENVVLVAHLGPKVVGFGRAEFAARKPPPYEHVPQGWYLVGLIVDPAHRRRGIGLELTRARLAWIAQRAGEAYYFANSVNRATIDLHARFGFQEIVRDFTFPRVTFTDGGVGVLFRVGL